MVSPLRRLHLFLFGAAPILFAVIALGLGKKTGWDLFNYHWYNPYALLNDRFGYDVAVAHHATYYNPLSDLPLYLLTDHGPAWLGGAFMGAMAGLTVALIGVLGFHLLPIENLRHRTCAAAALAFVGALGAGAFQEIGDPANDIPAALGILAAFILIVSQLSKPEHAQSWAALIVAGFASGAAIALKLTIAVYAVGLGGGLFFAGGSLSRRFFRSAYFSGGALAGLLIVGGFWMVRMWEYSGNPFFPYFNDLFHSKLLAATSYRDRNFSPHGLREILLFPYYFTIESRNVSESVFRDAHVLIFYALLPLTAAIRLARRSAAPPLSEALKYTFAVAAISYVAWLAMFDIYRYLIPLEMLAPLLIALAFSMWPVRTALKVSAVVATLVIAQLFVRVDLSDRQDWSGSYVSVSVPKLANSSNTMVLMTGHAPMAYVIPYFPKEIPFVRIDSWLVQGSDEVTGLALKMRERVRKHAGPFAVLFQEDELAEARNAALSYGLALPTHAGLGGEGCDTVHSNINQSLVMCEAARVERSSSN